MKRRNKHNYLRSEQSNLMFSKIIKTQSVLDPAKESVKKEIEQKHHHNLLVGWWTTKNILRYLEILKIVYSPWSTPGQSWIVENRHIWCLVILHPLYFQHTQILDGYSWVKSDIIKKNLCQTTQIMFLWR